MASKREQLVKTSIRLFAENGYHATGIDRITEEAGVSKKTLYRHFRTKEDLILAALRHHDELNRNQFVKQVESMASTPRSKLLAIFDVAQEWFLSNNFYGCMFINAVSEYSEPDTSIREICKEYKRLTRRYMEQLAKEAGIKDSARVAGELSLLLEGSIVTAQVSGNPDSAAVAKRMAKVFIDRALTNKQ